MNKWKQKYLDLEKWNNINRLNLRDVFVEKEKWKENYINVCKKYVEKLHNLENNSNSDSDGVSIIRIQYNEYVPLEDYLKTVKKLKAEIEELKSYEITISIGIENGI
jgi:hypothetical protein